MTDNFYTFHLSNGASGDSAEVGAAAVRPSLCLLMIRLWVIVCSEELRPYFLRRDSSVGKDVLDTGKRTRAAEGGSYWDMVASFYNGPTVYKSNTFNEVYFVLEKQYDLPSPDADNMKDPEEIKKIFINSRAKISKVCLLYFMYYKY